MIKLPDVGPIPSAVDGLVNAAEYARELQAENDRLKRERAEDIARMEKVTPLLARLTRLAASHERLVKLLEDRADVVDGPEGTQRANAEASVLAHWRGQ